MIRTTDAMLKAVQVQKAKARLQDSRDALKKAQEAEATEFVALFTEWVQIGEQEVAMAEAFLKNPAW